MKNKITRSLLSNLLKKITPQKAQVSVEVQKEPLPSVRPVKVDEYVTISGKEVRVPTPESLINNLRRRLQYQAVMSSNPGKAADRLRDLDELLADMPEKSKLISFYYRTVSQDSHLEQKKWSAEREFMDVKKKLAHVVKESSTDESRRAALEAAGIDVEAMKRFYAGIHYESPDARNVDHIVEKHGCGSWAVLKITDPLSSSLKPILRYNHLSNLVALPVSFHEDKNLLNALQGISKIKFGEDRWIAMIVPDFIKASFIVPQRQTAYAASMIVNKPPAAVAIPSEEKKPAAPATSAPRAPRILQPSASAMRAVALKDKASSEVPLVFSIHNAAQAAPDTLQAAVLKDIDAIHNDTPLLRVFTGISRNARLGAEDSLQTVIENNPELQSFIKDHIAPVCDRLSRHIDDIFTLAATDVRKAASSPSLDFLKALQQKGAFAYTVEDIGNLPLPATQALKKKIQKTERGMKKLEQEKVRIALKTGHAVRKTG